MTSKRKNMDAPASAGLVIEVRSELISELHSLDNKIGSVEKRLDSKIDKVLASVHRTQALMEEQRSENKVVLDGLKNVTERQDRVEDEFKDFRQTLQIFIKAQQKVV